MTPSTPDLIARLAELRIAWEQACIHEPDEVWREAYQQYAGACVDAIPTLEAHNEGYRLMLKNCQTAIDTLAARLAGENAGINVDTGVTISWKDHAHAQTRALVHAKRQRLEAESLNTTLASRLKEAEECVGVLEADIRDAEECLKHASDDAVVSAVRENLRDALDQQRP